MVSATLFESEKHKQIAEIPEPRATQLRTLQELYPQKGREDLPIRYVPDNRDLKTVKPLEIPKYHMMDRSILQPLLDALKQGDVELASALAPEGKRLCGYRVVSEAFEYRKWGGYAADIEDVRVEPGIYPIFAEKFHYHEAKGTYTNEINMYPGLTEWYDGIVTYNNLSPGDVGSVDCCFSHPYPHDIARSVLSSADQGDPSDIHLIYPFQAKEETFIDFDKKEVTTHKLFDSSLPELLPKGVNPLYLRRGGTDLPREKPSFADKLVDAQMRAAAQAVEATPGLTQPEKGR